MVDREFDLDVSTMPMDDFEVAEKWETALDIHTSDGRISELPEEVKAELDEWMHEYMNRREAEVGVSPISPRITEQFLDIWELDWDHRITKGEWESFDNSFKAGSTQFTNVKAGTIGDARHVIGALKQYGWDVRSINEASGDYVISIKFVPSTHDYEILRRLMVAGLSRAEAVSFWATEIVDKKIGGDFMNYYLLDDDFEFDEVGRLADALGISTEAVYMARKGAREKLEQIDPLLPSQLSDRRDGWRLPDEMWSEYELELLNRRQDSASDRA